MKKADVRVGGTYQVKVSGKLARVRLDSVSVHGGWAATNLDTGRTVHIQTAARLRKPLGIAPPTSKSDLWRQWKRLKDSNPGTVLIFQMGDMFEVYGHDAAVCGNVLGLAITMRTDLDPSIFTMAMAGFPYADLADNIAKLVAAGHQVAVCERVVAGEARSKPVETIIA